MEGGPDIMENTTSPQEGDLFRIYTVDGLSFQIRYGYHAENERGRVEPLPIFPDLLSEPVYTRCGIPVTSYIQAPCIHYTPRHPDHPEEWCGDCIHYDAGQEKMGRCLCPERKLE